MNKAGIRCLTLAAVLALAAAAVPSGPRIQAPSDAVAEGAGGFKVWRIPNVAEGAECYFSPDGRSLVFDGQMEGDKNHQVYTVRVDGTGLKRINDKGSDACSYFNPNGRGLIWTSTRDNLDLPPGNYSDPRNYPQGAEIYISDLDGGRVVRLTFNKNYDAEVTYAPDGHKILFGRQIEGRMDLWTMNPDGSNQKQITFTPDWQEGGSVYLPDNKTIVTRAWKKSEEGLANRSMQIFLLDEDGSNLRAVTTEAGVHWAPFPCPDGEHIVYVRVLPPRNYEIFLRSLTTGEERRLTFNDAFDGFPSLSPDGRLLAFSSTRGGKPGERTMRLYLMDIAALNVGPNTHGSAGLNRGSDRDARLGQRKGR